MTIGLCRVQLHLPESQSLKDKRQVIKSLITRIHNRFNVSAAEIDEHDLWQMTSIGISCVSTSGQHAHQVLSNVVGFIRRDRLDAELVDYEIEIIQALGN